MLRYRLARPWLTGLKVLRALSRHQTAAFRILLFHDVADDRLAALDRLIETVKRDYGVLTPGDAEAWLEDGAPTHRRDGRMPCLLTFDDGFASGHAVARGVLARHGVKALFFVCPGLIDLPGDRQRLRVATDVFEGRVEAAELAPGLRLMSWQEVRELEAMGHAVGAHGMTHRRLSGLGGEDLHREIAEAGSVLRARLGAEVSWFAYPFGTVSSISGPALGVIADHYRFCRSGVRGPNTEITRPRALRADHVDLEASDAYRTLVLEGGLDFRYAAARRRLDAMAAASS